MSEIEKHAPKLKLVPGLAYKGSIQVGLHWQPQWSDEGAERMCGLGSALTAEQWEELREWHKFRHRDALQATGRAAKVRRLMSKVEAALRNHWRTL